MAETLQDWRRRNGFAFVDGDSSVGRDGEERVIGFDAPEISHPEKGLGREPGADISTALSREYSQRPGVRRVYTGQKDVYNRDLVRIEGDGTTLPEEQLSRGLGFVMDDDPRNISAFHQGLAARKNPQTDEQRQINETLDREWASARPNNANLKKVAKRRTGEVFTDALSRGMDQMGMMAGGTKMLLGQMTGIDALEQSGIKQARENQIDLAYNRPDVGTLAKVDNVGDAVTWAVEKLGEQGPNLAAMLGTAAATAGVGGIASAMSARLAGEKLATQAASSALGFAAKGMTGEVGAALAGGTLNIGETKLELDTADPGGDHNLLALGTGILKTGLDVVSLKQMPGVGRIFASQGSRLGLSPRQAIEAFGDIPAAMLRSSVIEGGTEGLQTVLDEAAKKYQAGTEFDWANIGESAATGAFMGGVVGGGGGVAELGINNMLKPPDPNAPPPPALGAGTPSPSAPTLTPEARAAATDRLAQLSAIDPNDLTQEQQSERYSVERTLGMADSAEWGGQPPPPGGTTAEPQSDIAAQTAAVADPTHPKTAEWIADGDGAQARIDAAIAQGLQVLTLSDGVESGTLLSRDPQVLQSAREAFDMGASIRAINERLVYGGIPEGSKERAVEAAAAGEQPVVQQNTDAAGNVITEAASTPADAPAVSAALDAQQGPGETRTVTTVEGAQARRAALRSPPLPRRRPIPRGPVMRTGPPPMHTPAGSVTKAGRTLDERYDDVLSAIHFLGGMDAKELSEAGGFDEADLKGTRRPKFTPFRVVRTKGTQTPDGMRESLADAGYLPAESNLNDMYELIDRALRGERVLSNSADHDWFANQDAQDKAYQDAARAADEEYTENTPAPLLSKGIRPYEAGYSPAQDIISGVRGELAADRADANPTVDPRLPSTPSGTESDRLGSAEVAPVIPGNAPAPPRVVDSGPVRTRRQLELGLDPTSPPARTPPAGQIDNQTRTQTLKPLNPSELIAPQRGAFKKFANASSQLLANVFRGTPQRARQSGQDVIGALTERVKNSEWARTHLFNTGPKSSPTVVNGNLKTRADWNRVAATNAMDSVRQRLAEDLGFGPNDSVYGQGPQYSLLMHTMERAAENLTDAQFDDLLESLWNDNRYAINRIGRSKGTAQDRNAGISKRGEPMDAGRIQAPGEEYAGEDPALGNEDETNVQPEREITARRQAVAEAIAALIPQKLLPVIKKNAKGAVVQRISVQEQINALLDNPLFAGKSAQEIAQFVRASVGERSTLARAINAADSAYTDSFERAQFEATPDEASASDARRAAYEASSTAGRAWAADNPTEMAPTRADDRAAQESQQFLNEDVARATPSGLAGAAEQLQKQNAERAANGLPPLDAVSQESLDRAQQDERSGRTMRDGSPAPREASITGKQSLAQLESAISGSKSVDDESIQDQLEDPTTRPDVRQPVTLSERLFAGLANLADTMEGMRNQTGTVTASAFVDTLIKLGKPSKLMRLILTALKPFLAKTTLVFSDTATEPGQFDPATGTITLDSRRQTGEMVHVFLHEAFHAATYNGLRNNAIFNGRMTRMRERAILALKTTKINEADRQEIEYGLQNNDEFVAQLFSSPAFLNFLESIPVDRKTLLRKILNEIGNLLGLANNTTLAAAAMEDVLFEIAKGPQALDNTGAAVINAPNLRAAASSVVTAAQNASVRSVARAITEGTPKALNWMMHSFEAVQTSYRQVVLNLSQVMPKARAELYARRIKSFSDRLKTAQGINGAKVSASIEAVAKRLSMTQDEAAAEIAANWIDLEARNAMAPADRPPLTATQVVIKQFFDEMAAYIEGAGVKGFSRNTDDPGQVYLPQIYDKDALKANKAGAMQLLVGMRIRDPVDNQIKELDDTTAAGFIEGILSEHERGVNGDIPWAGSLKRRTLIDPRAQQALRDAGFLHKDAGIIMTYYASSVTKQAEFERTFGGWVKMMSVDRQSGEALETSVFPMAHGLIRKTINGLYGTEFTREQASTKVPAYLEAIERARRDGLLQRVGTQYKVWQRDYIYQRQLVGSGNPQVDKRIQLVFAGIMGNLGADMNPKWRRTQQWLMAAQAVTTLAFSTVSSIVEAGIHPAMAPSFNSMVGAVKRQMNSADREVTQRLLRMLGLGAEQMANIALNDSSQMDVPNLPRVILEKFFKLNFQHQWTQFMRGIAVDTVLSRLQEVRDTNNAAAAAELGLELSAIEHWLDNGMPVTGDTSAPHPVALAVRKFIDERVIMPDAISLPVFMNDPRFGLISQLKRFMYAYGHFIIGPLAERTAASYVKARAAGRGRAAAGVLASSRIALLGVFSMPLALLAGEMKDFLKYRVWGYPPPAFRDKEGLAAWVEVARKSGFLGPVDLAVNLFDDQSGGFAALAGPTASHLDVALEHGFMSEQFLRRSTPVAGQLPGLWKWMAEDDGY